MEFTVQKTKQFEKSMKKLKKKDKVLFQRIQKKIVEIIKNPIRHKYLRNVLAGYSRIQFGPFVLIFKINGSTIKFISLDHHDRAY